jgi:hypothetical protein
MEIESYVIVLSHMFSFLQVICFDPWGLLYELGGKGPNERTFSEVRSDKTCMCGL